MTVKIETETGYHVSTFTNAKFRHNEMNATAVVYNEHGQADLEWVEKHEENIYTGELLNGQFVKVIIE